jgi:type I restriction enzyme S subunit
MKKGWEFKKLRDIILEIKDGGTPSRSKPEYFGGNINWCVVKDISPEITTTKETLTEIGLTKCSAKLWPINSVIISLGATIGHVGIAKIPVATKQGISGIVVNQKLIKPEFLVYFLNYKKSFIQSSATGATIKEIRPSKLADILELFLPTLPEQQGIVSILDKCFEAIDKAKLNAESNLQNAKELFESYLNELFSKVFETNEKKFVSEIAEVTGGYSFKSTEFKTEGEYQVIRMGNVRPALIRENESPVFMDNLDEKVLKKALLIPNDVIITQTGSKNKRDYGFTVIIEKHNFLLNQRIARIRFSDKYLPKFFLYFSWTKIFKDQYFANETGTVGQGNVGIGAITDAVIPILTLEEQKRIIERIDALRNELQKIEVIYEQKLQYLDELKKSILQKAFNGELNTENIDL